MSEYASILRTVKENPAQTLAQLATLLKVPNDQTALIAALAQLVADARITKSGSGAGATYSSTATQ